MLLSSSGLYLALAALSRATCSRLNLALTLSNCQGLGPGLSVITVEGWEWGKKRGNEANTSEARNEKTGTQGGSKRKNSNSGRRGLYVSIRCSYEVNIVSFTHVWHLNRIARELDPIHYDYNVMMCQILIPKSWTDLILLSIIEIWVNVIYREIYLTFQWRWLLYFNQVISLLFGHVPPKKDKFQFYCGMARLWNYGARRTIIRIGISVSL